MTGVRQIALTGARQSSTMGVMNYVDRLHWYRESRFTAVDVTRATGLSERAQRELQKLGIIQPVPQPNPKAQRLLDATMLKRAAIIAALTKAGLSLGVAGRMVYSAILLEDLVFEICDPWQVHFDAGSNRDPETGLYQERQRPHNRETWFDPAHPPALSEADFYIAVVNARFVMFGTDQADVPYGELSSDLTDFIWWTSGIYDEFRQNIRDGVLDLSVRGVRDHSPAPFGTFDTTADPKTIRFTVKESTDADERIAEEARENPVTVLTINASLALRIALRRLLHIDSPADK